MKTNEMYVELVCADLQKKKLYVSSGTLERAHKLNSEAANLIRAYQKRYPFYKLERNDLFFCNLLLAQKHA